MRFWICSSTSLERSNDRLVKLFYKLIIISVATRWYRSPELILNNDYGKPVDM